MSTLQQRKITLRRDCILQLREPLLLIGVYLVFFALVILYCRCNFVLTRGAQWEAEDKAERIAFLVEEITDIINGERVLIFLSLPTSALL